MTDSTPDSTIKPLPPGPAKPEPPRVSLSLTQLVASVLAAVSASVAASVFGVAGTVIGAGLGSAVSVVGGAVYARSLERSRQAARLALAVATARRLGMRGTPDPDPDQPASRGRRLRLALTPQRLALGAAALFLITMGCHHRLRAADRAAGGGQRGRQAGLRGQRARRHRALRPEHRPGTVRQYQPGRHQHRPVQRRTVGDQPDHVAQRHQPAEPDRHGDGHRAGQPGEPDRRRTVRQRQPDSTRAQRHPDRRTWRRLTRPASQFPYSLALCAASLATSVPVPPSRW